MHHIMTLEAIKVTTNLHSTGPIIDIKEPCCGVVHPITKQAITQYKKLQHDPNLKHLWVPAMSKEVHWLAQGKPGITNGTNTIFFLSLKQVRYIPTIRTAMYAWIVIDHHPQKEDPNPFASLLVLTWSIILLNSPPAPLTWFPLNFFGTAQSAQRGVHFVGANIENMYLDTPLDWYEYMKMPLSLFPQDIIKHYGLLDKVLNGYVYMEIHKGMYGLPQAGILAIKLLKKRLEKHGYFEQPHSPGLWRHKSHQYGSTWSLMILGSSIFVGVI
jgi:hypothetical protein